jgi:hypothetical protein
MVEISQVSGFLNFNPHFYPFVESPWTGELQEDFPGVH